MELNSVAWCVQVELEAVRPGEGEGSEEELRLSIALLPLRLRIDQAVVDFCQVGLSITYYWQPHPTPLCIRWPRVHTRVQPSSGTAGVVPGTV